MCGMDWPFPRTRRRCKSSWLRDLQPPRIDSTAHNYLTSMQSLYRLLGEKRVAVTTATGASLAENWEAEPACPASVFKRRFARPPQARRRPRSRDNAQCSRSSYGLAAAEPLEGFR